MRIFAIVLALSLIGCVDDNTIEDSEENVSDSTDPAPDQTGDLPNDNKCTDSRNGVPGGGGVDSVKRRDDAGAPDTLSRKKADGSCN